MITKNINGQNLSQAFINAISDSTTPYIARLVYNNAVVSCDIKSVEVTKGTVASMENFNIGAVISSEVVAHVMNLTTNLKDEVIEVQIGLITDETQGTIEYIKMGEFVVSTAEKTAYETVLTAYGYTTSKTGGDFVSPQDLLPPQTLSLANIASQIENGTGVNIVWDSNIDTTAVLDLPLSGITNYQALQILASVVGGYAVDTNDGDIYIGLFNSTVTHSVSAGSMINLPQYEEQDFEITGVYVNTSAGAMGSQTPINLVTDSQWLTLDMFTDYESNIVGYTYRPAKCGLTMGDPRIEGTDVLQVVNIDGSTFVMPCHKIVHKCTGGLSSEIQSAVATQLENAVATPPPLSEQVTEAMSKANEALEAAQDIGDTAQYFWHTTTDTGAGAGSHITQVPQVDFLNDPTNGGGNTLIDSLGVKIRNGLSAVAKFLNSGITLGKDDGTQSYLFADYHSLQMIDRNRNVYVHISDLRDRSGYAEFVETFVATQGQTRFSVEFPVDSPTGYTPSVTVNSQSVSFSISGEVTFVISPVSAGDNVEITYKTTNFRAKAFSIGLRDPNADIGAMSYAEGLYTVASGSNSHAEGNRSVASGDDSHAEGAYVNASESSAHAEGLFTVASGYASHAEGESTTASGFASHAQNYCTIAGYDDQTAIGCFNSNKPNNAFEIGNGDGETERSNAFEVTRYGTTIAYPTEFSNGIGFKVQHGFADKDSGIETTRTDTSVTAMFGIGGGGLNHGIYSRKLGKWLIRGDDTNVYINQDVNISSQTANKVLASPNGSTGKPNFRELVAADIPNLNASKITAGTLGADRIPNLNASKITAGTLGAARLPNIVKIVSGTTSAFSLAGGAGFYKDVSISVPSGYTLVGCVGAISNHNQAVYIGSMYKSDTNKIRISGRNSGTSAFSDMTVTAYGLCVNSNVV